MTDPKLDRSSESDASAQIPRDTAQKSPASEPGETGESGGPKGLEPTRYGDWERNGRCIDF